MEPVCFCVTLSNTHTQVCNALVSQQPLSMVHVAQVCVYGMVYGHRCVCVCGVWQPLSMVHVAQSMLITTSFAAEVQVWGRPPANARSGAAGQRDADDD